MGVRMTKSAVKFTIPQIQALKRIALERKLKGSDVLNEYTDEQIAESFNGAGSSAAPEWQRWVLTKILQKKLPAVMIHDMTFRKGGTDADFRKANEDLRDNIRSSDGDEKSIWWNFVADKAKEYSDRDGRPGWGTV